MSFTIPNESDAAFADQAEPDSIDFDILIAGLNGDGIMNGCAVSAKSPASMRVVVAAGTYRIGGAAYALAGEEEVLGTAHGTYARFDLVLVTTQSSAIVSIGVPTDNPVFPSIPVGCIVVAAVYIPAADTDIDSDQIIDKRVVIRPVNSGTAVITSGNTSVVVTHGLGVTPELKDISILAGEDPDNSVGLVWVDTITSTQFTINCEADPGANNLDMGWQVRVL